MKYLLDTNTCIRFINGQSPSIAAHFHRIEEGDAVICSVVKAELFYGAMRSQHTAKTLAKQQQFIGNFQSLPFDDVAAELFGRIRADLAAKGTPIGPYDLMIAAIALAHDLVVVTHNVREFSRVVGLLLEDWEV